MELHQLEAFEAVALHRSFTRAAAALFLTQPAVTRQIASLETELHTRLFERLGRSVRLTASGEAFHRYAEQIIRLAREAKEAVMVADTGGSGKFTVGASSTLATYVLPPLLRRFRQAYPFIEIAIGTGVSAQIVEMVRSGEADVGLVTTENGIAAPVSFAELNRGGLMTTVLADYETGVVVPPLHALAARETVNATELSGVPLILMEPGTNLRAYVDRLLAGSGVHAQVAMELDNVEAIKRMIEAGLGISLLPMVSVGAEVAAKRLIALPLADAEQEQRRIAVVRRRDKYLSGPLTTFLSLLK